MTVSVPIVLHCEAMEKKRKTYEIFAGILFAGLSRSDGFFMTVTGNPDTIFDYLYCLSADLGQDVISGSVIS